MGPYLLGRQGTRVLGGTLLAACLKACGGPQHVEYRPNGSYYFEFGGLGTGRLVTLGSSALRTDCWHFALVASFDDPAEHDAFVRAVEEVLV